MSINNMNHLMQQIPAPPTMVCEYTRCVRIGGYNFGIEDYF